MKSKEEILESGILEQYALGLTDAEENIEVEKYLRTFPDLKDHISTIERAMEVIAHQQAIVPPDNLRVATMERIAKEGSYPFSSRSASWNWLTGIAAAIGVLAIGYGVMLTNSNNDLGDQIASLEEKIIAMDRDCALVKDDYNTNKRLLEMYMDENFTPVNLNGNNLMPEAQLVVFWNQASEKACLKIKNLQDAPAEHIYQIWADVDGKMISLGTFNNIQSIIDINYLPNAESLNVTIEKGTGSDHPDVSKLIMSNKV